VTPQEAQDALEAERWATEKDYYVRAVNVVCKKCERHVGFLDLAPGYTEARFTGSRRRSDGRPGRYILWERDDSSEYTSVMDLVHLPWTLPVYCPRNGHGVLPRRALARAAKTAVFSGMHDADVGAIDAIVAAAAIGDVQTLRVALARKPHRVV
jgi:hypothetical protein